MHSYETVTLTRDVDATRIPSGDKGFIPKDTEVTITQVLGGAYTVQFIGGLARIESKDADALGKTPEVKPAPSATPAPTASQCASKAPTGIGMPTVSPSCSAHAGHNAPAMDSDVRYGPFSLSRMPASSGSTATKNSSGG